MKNIAVMFLLLAVQAVSAQSRDVTAFGDWSVSKDIDVIDDSVIVALSIAAYEVDGASVDQGAMLSIHCKDWLEYPEVRVVWPRSADTHNFVRFTLENREVIFRIGTNEAVTQLWEIFEYSEDYNILQYRMPYDSSHTLATYDPADASALVAALLQDDSRFVVRAGYGLYETVTAIWSIEGLAEVIDECMAVFD